MGNANVIWQGDANAMTLRSFHCCESPPKILNLTGPEIVSIRWAANRFGELFEKTPVFEGMESGTALLNNAAQAMTLFGYPTTPLGRVMEWIAHWVKIDGSTLNKPTHFEEREGKF